jgi:hypothetical protein
MVTVSPDAASATTADAFCFSARIPTSDMCYIVAHGARQLDAVAAALLQRHPVADLLRGAWKRRARVRLADALYVELAAEVGVPWSPPMPGWAGPWAWPRSSPPDVTEMTYPPWRHPVDR